MIFSDYLDRLNNVWDYNEYVRLCDSVETVAMSMTNYYNYVGNVTGIMFLEGINNYKNAYLLFIEHDQIPSVIPQVLKRSTEKQPCKSCGGGRVL